jgi:uncharacterized protein (TIGR00725 family)
MDDLAGRKVVSVFGSSTIMPGSPEYERARRVGQLLAEAGLIVATGGFGGAMAAACRGAREAGGHTVGVTLPAWGLAANPWVCEERPQDTFVDRLTMVTTDADGYVVLDGGIGTLTEFSLAWSLLQTGTVLPRPLVAIGERWRRLVAAFAAELIAVPEHLNLVSVVDAPEDVVEALRRGWGGW